MSPALSVKSGPPGCSRSKKVGRGSDRVLRVVRPPPARSLPDPCFIKYIRAWPIRRMIPPPMERHDMNHTFAFPFPFPFPFAALFGCACLFGCQATRADEPHPVAESDLWLTYKGSDGGAEGGADGGAEGDSDMPGKGKHIVLLAAEQEYRSEQALPMLARALSKHHGFDCTVIFLMNEDGLVDPTGPSPIQQQGVYHNVPGLEHLAKADAFIWMSRFLKLNDEDSQHLHDYFDSGKPIVALRTANHGLRGGRPYVVNGKTVSLRAMLGGAFMKHHGGWKREATSGIVVEANKAHPVLIGVKDVWGTTDVYRCHNEDTVPSDCTALLLGQPMKSLERDAPPNTDKVPLPIAWTKTWTGNKGRASRILHFTMGSAKDFENEGVRRVVINGVYWGLGLVDQIKPDSNMSIVGEYEPLEDGFNYEKLGVYPRPASDFQ